MICIICVWFLSFVFIVFYFIYSILFYSIYFILLEAFNSLWHAYAPSFIALSDVKYNSLFLSHSSIFVVRLSVQFILQVRYHCMKPCTTKRARCQQCCCRWGHEFDSIAPQSICSITPHYFLYVQWHQYLFLYAMLCYDMVYFHDSCSQYYDITWFLTCVVAPILKPHHSIAQISSIHQMTVLSASYHNSGSQ